MLGSKVSTASSLTKSKNCGEFLNLLLDTRKNRNHRYSLRSFARDLQVSPTTLCYLFKNRRKISTFSALKISQNLQVTETELDHWHSLVLL
jgi:plasmid maintenance system antidote protein VapI